MATSQISETRRKWLTLSMAAVSSDDLDEAVHVPDGLHRAADALDEAGGAGHEALPAVQPGSPVRNVKVVVVWSCSSEHGALPHGFLAVSAMPWSGTETPSWGIAKMCEAASGPIACGRLAVEPRRSPPTVPGPGAMNGLRSPVWESQL